MVGKNNNVTENIHAFFHLVITQPYTWDGYDNAQIFTAKLETHRGACLKSQLIWREEEIWIMSVWFQRPSSVHSTILRKILFLSSIDWWKLRRGYFQLSVLLFYFHIWLFLQNIFLPLPICVFSFTTVLVLYCDFSNIICKKILKLQLHG